MASSSSSHKRNVEHFALSVGEHPGERRKAEGSVKVFDVFINHRGPDVKETLARELYNSLEKLGIRAFLDSEERELGDSFRSIIETAIFSARAHIAIFSKRYAESPWCLEELVLMRKTGVKIIPVFYEVKPSALRHIQKGVCREKNGEYDEAFKELENKSRYTEKKLNEWKEALDSISYVAGYEIDTFTADSCKEIVLAVQKQIQRIQFLHVAEHPVGLRMLVEDFERRCMMNEEGQGKARIVGICGMGGVGKTTLSKELYNRHCLKYTRASFLFDVREASKRDALYSLQLNLFKDLFDLDHPRFTSTAQGRSSLHDRLGRIPSVSFLIVLDNIDDEKQLDNLLVTDMVNKPGDSLIIITTRDAGVLRRAGIPTTYNLEGLDKDNARDLFCFHAFGQSNPARGYEGLVEEFVQACGRLPLSLQILGRHVKGKTDKKYWSSELRKLRKALPRGIKETLKISLGSLDIEQTQIFMDIACFFIGNSKNLAMRVWEGSGWEAHHALETLKEKSLVQEIEKKHLDVLQWEGDGIDLGMHDHLRDLGREMADECTAPRRIWKPEDLKSSETEGGFRTIIKENKCRCYHSLSDTSMGFQITYFLAETSASLLWLQLDLNSHEHPGIPSWIPLQNLQCLRISNGNLERLWQSSDQTYIPSWIPLQMLQYWRIIIGSLKRLWQDSNQVPLQLKELQISNAFLEEVPDLGKLDNLENVVFDADYMAIDGWSVLESLRVNISTLRLMSFTLEGKLASTSREEGTTPRYLIIRNFKHTEEIVLNKSSMSGLKNLEIGNQESVTNIFISGNHCPRLESLQLDRMENLIEINLLRVKTLNSLEVKHCDNLKSVSGISDLTELVKLNIAECPELRSELCLSSLYCLERIIVDRCSKLKCLELIDCGNLVELNITNCPELESELCLRNLYRLERITVDSCRKLKCLELIDCKKLDTVTGMEGLEELAVLKIRDCPELLQVPAHILSGCERITIDGCEKLNCHAFYSLLNLKIVTFDIGRAVEGAESILNPHLFSEMVGAEAVTEMDIPFPDIPQASVSRIIICGLVVVERSTSLECMNYRSQEFHLRNGRWIVTMVIADPKRNTSFISVAVEGMCFGILDKGFRVTLLKGQEWKTCHVLQAIDDKLCQK